MAALRGQNCVPYSHTHTAGGDIVISTSSSTWGILPIDVSPLSPLSLPAAPAECLIPSTNCLPEELSGLKSGSLAIPTPRAAASTSVCRAIFGKAAECSWHVPTSTLGAVSALGPREESWGSMLAGLELPVFSKQFSLPVLQELGGQVGMCKEDRVILRVRAGEEACSHPMCSPGCHTQMPWHNQGAGKAAQQTLWFHTVGGHQRRCPLCKLCFVNTGIKKKLWRLGLRN